MTKEEAEVRLKVYSEDAQKELEKLDEKTKKLRQDFADAFKKGDTKEIQRLSKEINANNRQLERMQTNAANVQAAMQRLDKATPRELRKAISAINAELNSGRVARGSAEWNQYIQKLKEAKAELKEVNAEMQEQQGVLSSMADKFNKWGASIAAVTAGLAGITMTAREAVKSYAEMQAEEANVRKYTGMTEQQVNSLNAEFKKMDTRTSRQELNKLAQEAGRLGKQSQEDVLGFVRASNQINVALDELGDGATLNLSKLTNIFGDETRFGTEQSLLKVGSVINELSQNCTASAPYLTDFAKRLAGVGNQAHMTIPEIMALGSVLDSQGQAVEMSATAVGQLITKMFKDPAKIAKAAGMDVKAFADTLKNDTNEALVMLLETLNKKGGLDALAPVFADMGADGARASGVISALAGKVDMLKNQIVEANKAFEDGTSVTKEYQVQNTTVEAKLEKARKRFNELTVELGERLVPVMTGAISTSRIMLETIKTVVEFVIEYRKELTLIAIAIGAYTAALKVHAKWQDLVDAKNKLLANGLRTLDTIWVKGKNVINSVVLGLKSLTTGFKSTAASTKAAGAAFKAVGFSGWLTILTLIGSAIATLVMKFAQASRAFKDYKDAVKESNEQVAEEVTKIDTLNKILHDHNAKLSDRQRALMRLKEIVKDYHADLTTEGELINENTEAINKHIEALKRDALVTAVKKKVEGYVSEKLTKEIEAEELRAQIKANGDNPVTISGSYGTRTIDPNSVLKFRLSVTEVEIARLDDQIAEIAKYANMSASDFFGDKELTVRLKPSDELLKTNKQYQIDYDNAVKEFNEKTKGQDSNDHAVAEAQTDLWNLLMLQLQDKYKEELAKISQSRAAAGERSLTEKERKAQERDRKKQEADEKKQKAQAEKERNERLAQYKGEWGNQKRDIEFQFSKGELNFYDYHDKLIEIERAFIEKCKAEFNAEQDSEEPKYLKFLEQEKKLNIAEFEHNKKKEGNANRIETTHRDNENQIVMDFYDPNSPVFQNQYALHQALLDEDLRYLEEKKSLYSVGTKEYDAIVKQMDEAVYNDQLRRQQEYADALLKFQKIYDSKVDRARRQKEEERQLEELRAEGLISEEQFQKALADIKKKYRAEEFDEFRAMGNEFSDMVRDIVESVTNLFENFSLENLGDALTAGLAVMSASMQQFSNYANAARDLELANLDKKYDAEVKAAGNNQRRLKRIEEKRQAEEAKIKQKYNDKAMKMEIAQALGQTAMAALNAYSSAVKVNFLLGPIAAAMATAFGMMQVATIKKQHEAQAAGYYSGGFTAKSPDNRKEVGVVHANEFVANHQAVANPALSPILRLIDTAQKSNTVGSLTAADVSNAIGQGVGTQPRIIESGASSQAVDAVNEGLQMIAGVTATTQQALNRLSQNIEGGINATVVISGKDGLDNKWSQYQQMKNRVKK
ncbi:MAG: phage tail tape measure protein [Bacteroides sp.]|nr:phage tail tape measure protein [Bacteroides sp.]